MTGLEQAVFTRCSVAPVLRIVHRQLLLAAVASSMGNGDYCARRQRNHGHCYLGRLFPHHIAASAVRARRAMARPSHSCGRRLLDKCRSGTVRSQRGPRTLRGWMADAYRGSVSRTSQRTSARGCRTTARIKLLFGEDSKAGATAVALVAELRAALGNLDPKAPDASPYVDEGVTRGTLDEANRLHDEFNRFAVEAIRPETSDH